MHRAVTQAAAVAQKFMRFKPKRINQRNQKKNSPRQNMIINSQKQQVPNEDDFILIM